MKIDDRLDFYHIFCLTTGCVATGLVTHPLVSMPPLGFMHAITLYRNLSFLFLSLPLV